MSSSDNILLVVVKGPILQGDVYHLVFELGEWLDGRVWPEEDEVDVLRLVALVHHVTGTALLFVSS